jgi:hypothetical protein
MAEKKTDKPGEVPGESGRGRPPAGTASPEPRKVAAGKPAGRPAVRGTGPARKKAPAAPAEPVLLSGGNPQIPKGDGDGPVQAYIAAMPGWKRDVGRRLDDLLVRTVPGLRKAVKWNSPFYGTEAHGWFLSIHCFTKYVKLAFFGGSSLRPAPPEGSRDPNTRYFHIHEGDELDEAQLASWFRQASALPGWKIG